MTPRFGIFSLPVVQRIDPAEANRAIREVVDDVRLAEELGFGAAWVAEHHGTPYGGACPSGLLMLAYLAARTSRIALGTAVTVLPLHDPTQVVEEALLVDHLSTGRLELGIGRGFLAVDFATKGVPFSDRHQLFEHRLNIVRQALMPQAAEGDAQMLYPAPFRRMPIPMWGAAATSAESIAFYGINGIGLMLNPYTRSVEEIADAVRVYRQHLTKGGHDAARARILIHEHMYTASTEEEARIEPAGSLMSYLAALRSASAETGSGGAKTEHNAGPQLYKEIYPGRVAFGTPEALRQRIRNWVNAGVTDFAFSVRFGGLASGLVQRSLGLFANEVAPAFDDRPSTIRTAVAR